VAVVPAGQWKDNILGGPSVFASDAKASRLDANTIRLSRRLDGRPAWPVPHARPRASGPGPALTRHPHLILDGHPVVRPTAWPTR